MTTFPARTCSKCLVTQHVTAFGKVKGGRRGICKWCWYERLEIYNKQPHVHERRKARSKDPRVQEMRTLRDRRSRYGDEAVKAFADIKACQICEREVSLHMDHDHETGKFRGALCFACNAALGLFKDDADLLQRAISYLDAASESTIQITPIPKQKRRPKTLYFS